MGAITTKGQVTIPKHIRDALGIRPGDRLEFDLLPDGGARVRPEHPATSRWARLRGIGGAGMTTDEIMRLTRGDPADDPEGSLSEEVRALLDHYALPDDKKA